MGDPLSVAGSIVGLIALGDVVFRQLHKYVRNVREAEKVVLGVKNEVAALNGVLHNLHLIALELEDDKTIDNVLQIDHIAACSATLTKIQKLASKINFKGEKIHDTLQRFKWPYKTEEMKELQDEVRRHRDTLSLALSADTMVALLDCLSSQKDIIKKLDRINSTLQRRTNIEMKIALDDERMRILHFFSTVQPRQYYETSLSLRHSGTGNWLYKDGTFRNWLQEPGSRLLLTGIAGAGKTVLSAQMIQESLSIQADREATAYYYCDYKNVQTHHTVDIFSGLAAQIATQNEDCFAILKSYYERLHGPNQMESKPNICDLNKVLQEMASKFDNVRIVLDALDECGEETATVATWLYKLTCAPHATISLAVLSRNEQVILDVLRDDETFEHLEITAHKEDLDLYVRSEIKERIQNKRLRIRSIELKELIVNELVSKADGMFRWVACQLDHLCDLPTDAHRRKALNDLPAGLNDTYERILLRIKEPAIPLVVKTLQWLAYGTHKISVEALLEALSVDMNSDVLDPEARPTEEDILLCCSSLVRKTGDSLELAHFTVQEYLQTLNTDHSYLRRFRLSLDAKFYLGKTCLSYLCLPTFTRAPQPVLDNLNSFRTEYPFHLYASIAWVDYMENLWDDPDLRSLYRRLFDIKKTPNLLLYAAQRMRGETESRAFSDYAFNNRGILDLLSNENFQPIHVASMFGLPEVCQILIKEGCNVNLECPLGVPLSLCLLTMFNTYLSMGFGSIEVQDSAMVATIVQLIDAGAMYSLIDENYLNNLFGAVGQSISPTTLLESMQERAKKTGYVDSVLSDEAYYPRVLHYVAQDQVDYVRDLSRDRRFFEGRFGLKCLPGNDLLVLAAMNHSVQTIDLLLDLGFDPTKPGKYGQNLLYYCTGISEYRLTDQLLDRLLRYPNIVTSTGDGSRAWHYAAAAGNIRILQRLIKNAGSDLEALVYEHDERTPLMYALTFGGEQAGILLVRTMHNNGIALDVPTIVHICVTMGHSRILGYMMELGYDLTKEDHTQRSFWFYLSPATTKETLDLLLTLHVEPGEQDAIGMTPFHAFLAGIRHREIYRTVQKDINYLIDRDTLIWQLDAVTEPIVQYIMTPESVKIQDCEGHTPWFYFSTSYLERVLNNRNPLIKDSLGMLVGRMIQFGAVEAYEVEPSAQNGIDLLCETVFHERLFLNETGAKKINQLFNAVVETKKGLIRKELKRAKLLMNWAINRDEKAVLKALLDSGVEVHGGDRMSKGFAPIVNACGGFGDRETFDLLISHTDPDRMDEPDGNGFVPTHAICQESTGRMTPDEALYRLEALLKAGADANACDRDNNQTALHKAASANWVPGIKMLLAHGADINHRDTSGWGVLAYAVTNSSMEVLQFLFLEEAAANFRSQDIASYKYAWNWAPMHHRGNTGFSILHLAVISGDPEVLEYLKETGEFQNVNERSDQDFTPLYFAAYRGAYDCAKWLIDNGADLDATLAETKRTALHSAVSQGHYEIVRLLIVAGAKFLKDWAEKWPHEHLSRAEEHNFFKALEGVNTPELLQMRILPTSDMQQFLEAIHFNNGDLCRSIIRNEPHITRQVLDCGTCTPFVVALAGASVEIVGILLDNGASMVGRSCPRHWAEGRTGTIGARPINLAIMRADLNLKLTVMLEIWCQEQSERWTDLMPLRIAAEYNPGAIDILHHHFERHPERYRNEKFYAIRELNMVYSNDTRSRKAAWWDPPLHIAARNSNIAALSRLLAYGADINERDINGDTALHDAVDTQVLEIVDFLLAKGANPNAIDNWMTTPLIKACKTGQIEMAKLLLKYGADKDAKTSRGRAAIHEAARQGHLEVFVFLIDQGCDPSRKALPGEECALGFGLQHSRIATYIYARGYSLDHLKPEVRDDFQLLHGEVIVDLRGVRLLRYLSQDVAAAMINFKSRQYYDPLVRAIIFRNLDLVGALLKRGASINDSGLEGSALIVACNRGAMDCVRLLVHSGAEYESELDGKRHTAVQAARHMPSIVHWLLVDRYTEQPRLTQSAAQASQDIKLWSGVRQLKVPLEGYFGRHNRKGFSLLEYVQWLYLEKEEYKTMVPSSWKPEEHFAALPGEAGHPLPAHCGNRVRLDGDEYLHVLSSEEPQVNGTVKMRRAWTGDADLEDPGNLQLARRESGLEAYI